MNWRQRCGWWVVHSSKAICKVIEKSLADGVVNSIDVVHKSVDFIGTFGEARTELAHHVGVWSQLLLLLLQLEILQVFDSHLQNVSFFQFRVSGILERAREKHISQLNNKRIIETWIFKLRSNQKARNFKQRLILTSFLRASRMRFFNSERLLFMRARLRFSIIGFVLWKDKRKIISNCDKILKFQKITQNKQI